MGKGAAKFPSTVTYRPRCPFMVVSASFFWGRGGGPLDCLVPGRIRRGSSQALLPKRTALPRDNVA